MIQPKLNKDTWLVLILVLIVSVGGMPPVFAHGAQNNFGSGASSSGSDQEVTSRYEAGDCASITDARNRQRCYRQEGSYAVVAQQEENCDEISNPRERQRCRMRQQGGSR